MRVGGALLNTGWLGFFCHYCGKNEFVYVTDWGSLDDGGPGGEVGAKTFGEL